MRQLHFIFKIRHRTQATNQHRSVLITGEVRHQITKPDHFHVPQMRGCLLCQRHTLFQSKHRFFTGAGGNRQNNVIEHLRGARHDIDMTIGNGIESTRINRPFLHNNLNAFSVAGKVPAVEAGAVARPGFDTVLQRHDGHRNYGNRHR